MKHSLHYAIVLVALALIIIFVSCGNYNGNKNTDVDTVKLVNAEPNDMVQQNLTEFDTLDFHVFNGQQFDRLAESHAQDIKVFWPDGHTTTGLPKHIEDLKAIFAYAPDAKITEHPIRIGQGNITAVTGVFTGTFTQPMKTPGGKTIQPTGKAFKIPMATFGVWKDGVMTEEHLFWDNYAFMQQVGLMQ